MIFWECIKRIIENTLFNLSEKRFTYGNLIVLYSIHKNTSLPNLPSHIVERIDLCNKLYNIILKSKPDGNKTLILIVADPTYSELVKNELINRGINKEIIIIDSDSKQVSQTFDNLKELIIKRINPPKIYFVGSVWLKDLFDSIVTSQFKEYQIQFEGALDHRPVIEVENEKSSESPKKGSEYIKQTIKNKAIDMLLNYIFPEDRK